MLEDIGQLLLEAQLIDENALSKAVLQQKSSGGSLTGNLVKIGALSEEVLLERIRQIDLMDGQLDGKVSTKVKRCTRCNRVMSRRHGRCLYCGAQDLEQTAIDAVS